MEEQASYTRRMRNKLTAYVKRFPKSPRQQKNSMNLNMSPKQQQWYKKQFGNELVST